MDFEQKRSSLRCTTQKAERSAFMVLFGGFGCTFDVENIEWSKLNRLEELYFLAA